MIAPVGRSCAPCTACCDFPALPELDKQAYSLCQHASAAGCAIYAGRPAPCAAYTCLWLEGEFAEGDRPDRIGLAFDLPALIQEHPDYAGVHVICARELWEGARDEPRAGTLLLQLSGSMIVRLTPHGGGRASLLGPRALIELVARRAAERAGG